jgi:hypothetical protein
MATVRETSPSAGTTHPWALPLAAIILVAGSLAFWTCVGALWLAARPAPQAPIVIYMPAEAAASAERSDVTSVPSPSATEEHHDVATR